MRYYVGRPDKFGMFPLPPASRGASTRLNRGEVSVALGNGGTATARSALTKRVLTVSFDPVSARDGSEAVQWSRLRDLYRGLYGGGPYRLIDPNDVNLLELDDSRCAHVGRWAASVGGVSAVAGFPAGALVWSLPASRTVTGLLHCGPIGAGNPAGDPDGATAVPYLADRSLLLSATITLTSGAPVAVALRVSRRTLDGFVRADVVGLDTVASATPRRLRLWVEPGTLGQGSTGYVTVGLVARSGASASTVALSQPQLEYPLGLADVGPLPWEPGMGAPTVTVKLSDARQALHRQRSYGASFEEV